MYRKNIKSYKERIMTKITYDEALIEKLKNEKAAEGYFFAVLEECKQMDKEMAQKHFAQALENITKAQGGFGNFVEKIGLNPGPFYRILSSAILKLAGNCSWFNARNN